MDQVIKTIDGIIIKESDRIFHKKHRINGKTIEHSVYNIPGNDVMKLYIIRVGQDIALSLPFLADNNYYVKQAYQQLSGIFSPKKVSHTRLKHHTYSNRRGQITIHAHIN
jgi:hypothetical protein